MPRLKAGAISATTLEAYSGLSRNAVRTLMTAELIAPLTRLSAEDAVIARLMRRLYWAGPAINTPGESAERDAVRAGAVKAAKLVRAALKKGVPDMVRISDNGTVTPLTKGALFDLLDNPGTDVLMIFPLAAWHEEAKQLPEARA